jgi:CheY-like chemotaxis protein
MRAERSPGPLLTGLRVLCVDNEASILVAMKALLERWGVKVTAAGSSRAAAALNGAGM